MFNKKFLLATAVATAVVGNANALEANGFNVSGGVGAEYNYSKDKKINNNPTTEFYSNEYNLYRARVSLSKDLSNLQKGLSVSAQVDGKDSGLFLNTATLNYSVNDSLSLSVGNGYYGWATFGDNVSSYRSAFTSLAGASWTGDYKTYGGELYYSAGSLSFTLNGGVREGKDLLDTTTGSDNNTRTTFFDVPKKDKSGIVAARVDFLTNGVNLGLGLAAQNTYNVYDRVYDESVLIPNQTKRSLLTTLDLSVSYAKSFGKNTVFAYVAEQMEQFKPKLDSDYSKVTLTQTDLVAGLLFGVNGEFDNFGTVAKADNFVYAGVQYENLGKTEVEGSKDDINTLSKITGVLGYAPNPNVVVSAEYSLVKQENDNGTKTVDVRDAQEAKLNVRVSF